ncbi:hypothetical protein [Aquipuribacter nitratireducens]|uniref:Uncharacterized protein n=1 Tax=Aquipuribacter nitratireducens TaxID=650104 RepID=A0ABW0GR44_9MICO
MTVLTGVALWTYVRIDRQAAELAREIRLTRDEHVGMPVPLWLIDLVDKQDLPVTASSSTESSRGLALMTDEVTEELEALRANISILERQVRRSSAETERRRLAERSPGKFAIGHGGSWAAGILRSRVSFHQQPLALERGFPTYVSILASHKIAKRPSSRSVQVVNDRTLRKVAKTPFFVEVAGRVPAR